MRWVFFCLLILNVVYLVWNLVAAAVTPAVPQVAPAAASAPTLALVDETVAGGQRGQVSASQVQPELALCATLGPWESAAAADKVLSGLSAQGYRGTLRTILAERERLHWVYLPAYPDRDAALRVLRELQSRDVDSFVVSDGEDANAISLGYFSSEESARGLAVKMKAAGYPAETRVTNRKVSEYWLYFPVSALPDGGERLRALMAENQALKGLNVACSAPPTPDGALDAEAPRD
ncbi:MAG: SPOR domain-containing protein [Alcanivoracaceae bacterium]|jgi:cell division septation protein DedD|nr:SPOR domain-containing protein [Alcanivoracaceae bacterium]